MQLRIWGVRGSIPTPLSNQHLQEKLRFLLAEATPEDLATDVSREALIARSLHGYTFGGNTSCLELSFGDTTFVLDAGSGARDLGGDLRRRPGIEQRDIHMFFTHFHWDHICGFPFFQPILMPSMRIDLWSGREDMEDLLAVQMSSAHFPLKWTQLPSEIVCHTIPPASVKEIAGAKVRIMRLEHPDLAWGYRFDLPQASICYITDTEVSQHPNELAGAYAEFVAGADVVIADAMYGFLKYHDSINFGHSTIFNWIDFFGDCDIGELVIFHHDHLADDLAIHKLLASAEKYKELVAPHAGWRLSAAREGQTWDWA